MMSFILWRKVFSNSSHINFVPITYNLSYIFPMKFKLCLIIFILCISINAAAQDKAADLQTISVESLQFVPYEIPFDAPQIPFTDQYTTAGKLLYSTGCFLQGLKFRSPVDQFHAFTPFDIRGYRTGSVQEYEQLLVKNQFLFISKTEL